MHVFASVPERPANKYVLDEAGVLSDKTEKEIIEENKELFEETGAEVVVVAVDFLGGQEIDDYAYDLFNDWGIGSSQRDNGILLVLAVGEDNYYALSGYGLEDYFDGAKFRELLDEYLEEDFAKGDYDQGVGKFFEEVVGEVENYYDGYTDEYTEQDDDISDYDPYYSQSVNRWSGFVRVIANVFRVAIVMVILIVVIRVFSGRGRGGRGGPPYGGGGGGNFWAGMMLGNMMGRGHRRNTWGAPPPPPPPGGFGGPRPGGHRPGGFGGFTGGGRSGGFGGRGGFTGGGGSHGGGAGRR